MAVKIYSDKTNKFYESVEAANKAEFELKEEENRKKILAEREAAEAKAKKEAAAAERRADAEAVEEKRKIMVAAQRAYREEIDKFVKKHGSYHWTSNSADDIPTLFDNFFNPIFKALL